MTGRTGPLSDFIVCLAGPCVWAAHFFVVYGAESVVCVAAASPASAMRWTILAATAAALALIAAPLVSFGRIDRDYDAETSGFLRTLARWLAGLSALAVIAVALSGLSLPACVPPAG